MDYTKEFYDVIHKFSYKYDLFQIWNDFLILSATSVANGSSPHDELWNEREATYLQIINKYPKDCQNRFVELFTLLILALDNNPEQDFLGEMYHKLNLQKEQRGQFFTPYHICELMAELNFTSNFELPQKEKSYITVNDPTCGSGAMLIAFANVAKKHNVNYQKDVLFFAQDIDRTAAMMCYLQLSLLGCPAIVIIGDSLVKPDFHPDNEVWCSPLYYMNQWKYS